MKKFQWLVTARLGKTTNDVCVEAICWSVHELYSDLGAREPAPTASETKGES